MYIYLEPLCSPFWVIDLYYGMLCYGQPIIRPFVKNTGFCVFSVFLEILIIFLFHYVVPKKQHTKQLRKQ